jgi:hypothetical protein
MRSVEMTVGRQHRPDERDMHPLVTDRKYAFIMQVSPTDMAARDASWRRWCLDGGKIDRDAAAKPVVCPYRSNGLTTRLFLDG